MKRLQIFIEEDLDAALERQARKERRSKAALIRNYVRERLKPLPPLEADPIWQLVGRCRFPPEPIDEVVYR
jgi:hypothetical protein